jgi:molecular chaperone GrpE (heat shock protein)
MLKKWWLMGIGLVLATVGCRFVESTAEQQAGTEETTTASTAVPGGEVQPTPEAGTVKPTETESPTTPTAETEGETEPAPPATGAEPPEEGPSTPEPSAAGEEEAAPASPETAAKEGPTATEPPAAAQGAQTKPAPKGPTAKKPPTAEAEPPAAKETEAPPETAKKPGGPVAEAEESTVAAAEKEVAEELEEVPGGGVKPKTGEPAAPKPAPKKETPLAEAEPTKEEKPEKEAKAEGEEEPEARETVEGKEAEREEEEAERRRIEAQQKVWEEAEADREAQRQAAFAAVKRHLAQVEDALDGQRNDLPEALSGLQRMRRSLSFLRSELTSTATWHHLDCALALLEDNQVDAAKEQLTAAIALTPVATPEVGAGVSASPEKEPTADEGVGAGVSASPEGVGAGVSASPEKEPSASPRRSGLRERLAALSDALGEDPVEHAKRTLERILSEAPTSEAEALMDDLEAEIDYASEALSRASRRAAEVELESIRANVDELARLVLGESEPALAEAEEGEEAAGLGKPSTETGLGERLEEEEGEVPARSAGSSEEASKPRRTSWLPAAAFLGTLAAAVLLWTRTRRPRG